MTAKDVKFSEHVDTSSFIDTLPEEVDKDVKPVVTILDQQESQSFKPMLWPILDDGKPRRTNALGYPVGGWYQDQKAKYLSKKEEEEKKALEKEEQEQALALKAQLEKEQEEEQLQEKIEKLKAQAQEEGFSAGHTEGFTQGYDKGLTKGHAEGYDKGYEDGLNQGYEDGVLKGKEDGFFKGQEEGLKNAESIVTTQVNRFRHIADLLANPMRQVDRDITDELCYLVSRLCAVLLGHEIKTDAQFIKNTIQKAIEVLPNAKKGATIYLNEHDYDLVTTLVGNEYIKEQNWDLQVDSKLNIGDVIVSNEVSSIDWRINDRIDALINNFLIESQTAVDSALREHLEDFPSYEESEKIALAPKPNLHTSFDDLAQSLLEEEQQAQEQAIKQNQEAAKAPESTETQDVQAAIKLKPNDHTKKLQEVLSQEQAQTSEQAQEQVQIQEAEVVK